MTDTTFIYALLDPESDDVRYVGKADDINKRLLEHVNCYDGHETHKARWVHSLREQGKEPKLIVLEEVPVKQWKEAEKRWIAHYKEAGASLTNVASTHAPTGTTTLRIYPDDAAVLKATRQWLQKLYGSDHTIADALHYAVVNLTITNPSILAMIEE